MGGGLNSYVNYSDSSSNSLNDSPSSESDPIMIDDSNFDTYFDRQGFISSDIESNSSICFGNLSNRYIKLDIPLKISSLADTTIFNSTIEILEDASGSRLNNLNLYTNATAQNSNYFTPIYISEANDLIIENNSIFIDYYNGCNYNLAGIYATGASNNIIRNNRVTISSNEIGSADKKYYIYGIDFSIYNSESSKASGNNTISGNTIDLFSNYYLSAVVLSCSNNDQISNNSIYLNSLQFAYGITGEYFYNSATDESSNVSIINNRIEAVSNMVYLIELFSIHDYNISGNTLSSNSNASYAISAYESHNLNIENNDIKVVGKDTSLVGFNVDAISTGHNGMYFLKDSHDINITNNNILSIYELGGDYAIRCSEDSNSNILIFNNNLSSNNYLFTGNDAVYGDVSIFNNNPYSDDTTPVNPTEIIIKNIYVNVDGSDSNGDGSLEKPFASINQALVHLNELNKDSGSVKGIIHIAPGSYSGSGHNARLYITDLMVDLIGEGYNQTFIAGDLKNWFFDISKDSTVNMQNLSFVNGIYRNKNGGLIYNKGTLSLKDCAFINSKLVDSSAIIYNDGILSLKNNILGLTSEKGYQIYNNGLIDNLVLNFISDSSDENERTISINSSRVNLTAFVHDDMGNLVTGGFIKFYIQSKEMIPQFAVLNGKVSNETIISLMGTLKVSGYYSGSYTNTFINLGRIISSVNVDDVSFYVSAEGSDTDGDGTLDNPYRTVNKAISYLPSIVDHCSIYLSCGNFSLPSAYFEAPYGLSIIGSDETYIRKSWDINCSNSSIMLKNLIFNGTCLKSDSINLTVNNCSFYNAPVSAISSRDTNLIILKSNFIDNGNTGHSTSFTLYPFDLNDFNLGGAVYNVLGNLTIIDSNFINNGAVFGGAIFNNQSDLHISSSNFIGNIASAGLCITPSFGGAIYQYLGKEIIVSDCIFLNNSATAWGGAFYSSGTQPNMIENGTSQHPEYDVEYSFQEIYFINTVFAGNIAPNGGGALYIINNSFTEYISCTFANNVVYTYSTPNLYGFGAGANWISADEINHEQDSISSSQLNLGGAFYDRNVHIVESSFESNTYNSGGALILPTIIHNSVEWNYISYDLPIHVEDSGTGGQSIYVSDSSQLSAEDSQYLGISGWSGSRTDGSVLHSDRNLGDNGIIRVNGNGSGSEIGIGDGGGSTGDGSGTGSGDISAGDGSGSGGSSSGGTSSGDGNGNINGNGGSGALTMEDILSYLESSGSDLIVSNGSSISLEDLYNMIYSNSTSSDNSSESNNESANNTNSSSEVPVDPTETNSSSEIPVNPVNTNETVENPNNNSDINTTLDTNTTLENSNITSDVDLNNTQNNYDDSIDVNSTNEIVVDEGQGAEDKDKAPTDVGLSEDPLGGESSDNSADSSENPSSSSPAQSSPGESSANAYQIYEDKKADIMAVKNIDVYSYVLIFLFSVLLILGYYRESKDDKN